MTSKGSPERKTKAGMLKGENEIETDCRVVMNSLLEDLPIGTIFDLLQYS